MQVWGLRSLSPFVAASNISTGPSKMLSNLFLTRELAAMDSSCGCCGGEGEYGISSASIVNRLGQRLRRLGLALTHPGRVACALIAS